MMGVKPVALFLGLNFHPISEREPHILFSMHLCMIGKRMPEMLGEPGHHLLLLLKGFEE